MSMEGSRTLGNPERAHRLPLEGVRGKWRELEESDSLPMYHLYDANGNVVYGESGQVITMELQRTSDNKLVGTLYDGDEQVEEFVYAHFKWCHD